MGDQDTISRAEMQLAIMTQMQGMERRIMVAINGTPHKLTTLTRDFREFKTRYDDDMEKMADEIKQDQDKILDNRTEITAVETRTIINSKKWGVASVLVAGISGLLGGLFGKSPT